LIHGFTGTPKEMRWMGEYLHQQGYTCLGIRLAGHATQPEDMIRSRWTDWTASVEDGYNILSGIANDIFLVGLSMGGTLSLLMSTRLTPRVKGVVAMSTPSRLPRDYQSGFTVYEPVYQIVQKQRKLQAADGLTKLPPGAYCISKPGSFGAELKKPILRCARLCRIHVPFAYAPRDEKEYTG
jgi:carboxylesterase